jgi:protocatechuate 3,4-dioxygenase beta subunit
MRPSAPFPAILTSRRRVLRATLGVSAAALGAAVLRPGLALAAACQLTPAQSEGPYYPTEFGAPGNDLLTPGADGALPRGEPIAIVGRVTDAACRPVAGAVVEIWQADGDGRYAHPSERRSGEPDPRFRYWGRAVTDAHGGYRFRTLLPGAYRAGFGWMRPPHVHFKVRPVTLPGLTTQMYFPDQPLNEEDALFGSVPAERRHTVLAVREHAEASTGGAAPFRFDIAVA